MRDIIEMIRVRRMHIATICVMLVCALVYYCGVFYGLALPVPEQRGTRDD